MLVKNVLENLRVRLPHSHLVRKVKGIEAILEILKERNFVLDIIYMMIVRVA